VIAEEKLADRAVELGARLTGRLKAMAAKNEFACIGEVRGLGAMVAMELVKDRTTHEPAPELTKALVAAAAAKGLIILSCGTYGNVIRFLAPLVISDAQLDEGLDILESCLAGLTAAA